MNHIFHDVVKTFNIQHSTFNILFWFLGGSRGSTPEQDREGRLGTSPHINRFLAREPPDGCEKVNLKFVEEAR